MGAIVGCIGGKITEVEEFTKQSDSKLELKKIKINSSEIVLLNKNIHDNIYEDEKYLICTDSYIFSNKFISIVKSQAFTILDAWKNNTLDKLSGSYIAVIYDKEKSKFHLLRDFTGDKIFYYKSSNVFLFSSYYKNIKHAFNSTNEIDLEQFYSLINVKKIKDGKTLYSDVKIFPQGYEFIIDVNGKLLDMNIHTTLNLNIIDKNESEIKKEIKNLLYEALEYRLHGLNKVGIALSSGIDSIGLAYMVRKIKPNLEIHTFTTGFGQEDPEIMVAKDISDELGTIHHELLTTNDDINSINIKELVYLLEDPLGRTETLQFLILAREASKFVDNIILGVGSDALYAGMKRHKYLGLIKKYPLIRNILKDIYNLGLYGKNPNSILLKGIIKIANIDIVEEINNGKIVLDELIIPKDKSELINKILLDGFIPGNDQSYQKYDKILNYYGLKGVTPYHDITVIKNAFTITDKLKIKNGIQKYILREAFVGIVNSKHIYNKKRPQKMLHDEKLYYKIKQIVEDEIINNSNSALHDFISMDEIKKFVSKSYIRKFLDMASMKLWTIILLEYWLRMFSSSNQKDKKLVVNI